MVVTISASRSPPTAFPAGAHLWVGPAARRRLPTRPWMGLLDEVHGGLRGVLPIDRGRPSNLGRCTREITTL